MIVVPAEKLIGGSTADRNVIFLGGHALHQKPMGEISDGENRSIVLAHQRFEFS